MAGRLQNLEKWIGEISVNSHVETIIVHDFADEVTREQLQLICSTIQNVQLIEGEFGNPGSARNAGLSICKGERIVFWDCDDEPNTANFLHLLQSKEQENTDICVANYKIFNEITESISKGSIWSGNFDQDSKTFALNPGIWRMIFKKELLSDITFNSLRMAEDQIFICQAMLKAKTITYVDDQIYTYFIGSPNHLTKNKDALQDLLPAIQKTKAIIRKNVRVDMVSFLNLMAARQFIAGLNRGSMHTKIWLMASSIERGFMFRPSFIKALIYVLKNNVRG